MITPTGLTVDGVEGTLDGNLLDLATMALALVRAGYTVRVDGWRVVVPPQSDTLTWAALNVPVIPAD